MLTPWVSRSSAVFGGTGQGNVDEHAQGLFAVRSLQF